MQVQSFWSKLLIPTKFCATCDGWTWGKKAPPQNQCVQLNLSPEYRWLFGHSMSFCPTSWKNRHWMCCVHRENDIEWHRVMYDSPNLLANVVCTCWSPCHPHGWVFQLRWESLGETSSGGPPPHHAWRRVSVGSWVELIIPYLQEDMLGDCIGSKSLPTNHY